MTDYQFSHYSRQVQLHFIDQTLSSRVQKLLASAASPLGHLAGALADRFSFAVDYMVDFVQTGHGTDAVSDHHLKGLVHFYFEFNTKPCGIANRYQLQPPYTRLSTTFDNLDRSYFCSFGQFLRKLLNLPTFDEVTWPL